MPNEEYFHCYFSASRRIERDVSTFGTEGKDRFPSVISTSTRKEKEQPLDTACGGALRENLQGFLSGSPALFRIVDVIRVARSKERDDAPVAQSDRATGFEPVGWVFDSPRARHKSAGVLR